MIRRSLKGAHGGEVFRLGDRSEVRGDRSLFGRRNRVRSGLGRPMGENGSGMGWIESVVSSALSLFSYGFGERGRIARVARSDYYGTIIPNLVEQLGKGGKHPFTFADRQYEPFVTRRVDLTKGEQRSVEGIMATFKEGRKLESSGGDWKVAHRRGDNDEAERIKRAAERAITDKVSEVRFGLDRLRSQFEDRLKSRRP